MWQLWPYLGMTQMRAEGQQRVMTWRAQARLVTSALWWPHCWQSSYTLLWLTVDIMCICCCWNSRALQNTRLLYGFCLCCKFDGHYFTVDSIHNHWSNSESFETTLNRPVKCLISTRIEIFQQAGKRLKLLEGVCSPLLWRYCSMCSGRGRE